MSLMMRTASALGRRCTRTAWSTRLAFSSATAGGNHDGSLTPEENLAQVLKRLNVNSLPPPPPLGGLYVPVVRTGKYVYISGQPPLNVAGEKITGVCETASDVDAAKEAAMWNGLTMLATLKVCPRGMGQDVRTLARELHGLAACITFCDCPVCCTIYLCMYVFVLHLPACVPRDLPARFAVSNWIPQPNQAVSEDPWHGELGSGFRPTA